MPPHDHPVQADLIGEAAFLTLPGDEAALFGSASLEGPRRAEVRTWQSFRLTWVAGKLGLDDSGGIRVAFRLVSDAGPLQTTDPAGPNYVSASTDGAAALELSYERNGGQRPWNEVLTIRLRGGYLTPGQKIEIRFGDTTKGSPGLLMPTFADSGRVFRVMADVQATGVFVPLPGPALFVTVVPGPVHRHVAILPTLRRPGQPFTLGLRAEDLWGNPTPQGATRLSVRASLPVAGLPEVIDFAPETGAMTLEGLTCAQPGELRIALVDPTGTTVHAGPLRIADRIDVHFWGDLHGQTGETVGTNTAEHYFDFARNKAFLDVAAHQGNDFQITGRFWQHLNQLTAEADEPGRFTVFPGYEWSGNTAVGGDHNVYYLHEGAPIFRCSHALVADRSDAATDAHTLTDLYARLRDQPTPSFMYAHVGGRYADIRYDHDPRIEAAVEVHSAWGSFEWILTDGFALGRRVGVVCNSDGHKGRPGASYPGASVFGAMGGLTCFVARDNTRAAIHQSIRRRHTYGTSGPRVFLDLSASLPPGSLLFPQDPYAFPGTPGEVAEHCILGDIVQVNGDRLTLALDAAAAGGIEGAALRAGAETIGYLRSYGAAELGQRIRVMWSGAEYRGRGRATTWRGRAELHGARIARFAPVNQLNPEQLLRQVGSASVVWSAVTTGNRMGFDLWLHDAQVPDAQLDIRTNLGDLSLPLAGIGVEPVVMQAGGLDRALRVQRLPDAPLPPRLSLSQPVPVAAEGDTPIWIRLDLEDGNQAWTSPIYAFRNRSSGEPE